MRLKRTRGRVPGRSHGAAGLLRRAAAPVTVVALLGLASCTADASPESSRSASTADEHFSAFDTCDDHPAPWLCATIEVPLDHDDDSAGIIPLRILGIPHSDASSEEKPPFFAIPGGPGSAGLENYALWQVPGMIRAHHDVVTIDPRGTGLSAAIDCPAVQRGSSSRERFVHDSDACGQQLGAASDLYGAAQTAMDIDAVRDFMGYDRTILHGTSYGGVGVQAYASRFPDRLAAVVIDGGFVVDDSSMFFGTDVARGIIGAVDAACRADAACTASTDDPGGVVSAVVRTLAEAPIVVDGAVAVDEASIATLTRENGLAVEVVAASIRFSEGDTAALVELVSENDAIGIPAGGEVETFSAGANAAAWCTDQRLPFELDSPPTERRDQLETALAALDDDAFAPWSKPGWRQFWLIDQCVGWPSPSHQQAAIVGDASSPGIPALLLVGDQDPALASTPALQQRFPDGATVVVPGARHPALSRGPCVATFEAEFIETLKVPDAPPCGSD